VPLLFVGTGRTPARWEGTVSTLDVVPSILRLLAIAPVNRLDGAALPLLGGRAAAPDRPFVTWSSCLESRVQGDTQYVFWFGECLKRWKPDDTVIPARLEVSRGDRTVASELTSPSLLRTVLPDMKRWIGDRVARTSWLLAPAPIGRYRVEVSAAEGRIVDWGPSNSRANVGGIRSTRLDDSERRLVVEVEDYAGALFVATEPEAAPVRIEVFDADGRPASAPFVLGPLGLPLPLGGKPLDPRAEASLLDANGPPDRRGALASRMAVWRQSYQPATEARTDQVLADMNRVLREWGYVR
jgi:hypothetical protein